MTNHRTIKVAIATIFWTVSIAVGISGTLFTDIRLLFWAGLSALVACLVTSHVVVEAVIRSERIRVESLVEGMVVAAQATVQNEIRNLR